MGDATRPARPGRATPAAVTGAILAAVLGACGAHQPAPAATTTGPRAANGATATTATTSTAGPGTATASTASAAGSATATARTVTVASATTATVPASSSAGGCRGGTVQVSGQAGTEPQPVCLLAGALLVVGLTMSSTAGGMSWQLPATSDATVLPRLSAATTAGGGATATFAAAATGQASVTASTDAACFHVTPPCLIPSFLWRLAVTVTR